MSAPAAVPRELSETTLAIARCSLTALFARAAREIEALIDELSDYVRFTDEQRDVHTILIVRLRSTAKETAEFTGEITWLKEQLRESRLREVALERARIGQPLTESERPDADLFDELRALGVVVTHHVVAQADGDGGERKPTPDEQAGMDWWNGLSPTERAARLTPVCDSVAKAWEAFKAESRIIPPL